MLHQAKGEKANRRTRPDMPQRNGENDDRRQHETDQPDRAVGPIIRQSCRARTDHPLTTPQRRQQPIDHCRVVGPRDGSMRERPRKPSSPVEQLPALNRKDYETIIFKITIV
jgi:hypothetical protein